ISTIDPRREGGWVARLALRERRPSSVVVRSTKTIAQDGFAGRHYRLIAKTTAEVEAMLDRYAIDTVILDEFSAPLVPAPEHHRLLRAVLAESVSWKECAREGDLYAFCRIAPPKVPREPLRINMAARLGRDIIEKLP